MTWEAEGVIFFEGGGVVRNKEHGKGQGRETVKLSWTKGGPGYDHQVIIGRHVELLRRGIE